nr:hypothetical protein [Tanacetum cinerariifolium]
MEFVSTVMASHFPLTNNQLKTSCNPRNQATIQDGRVTVQQVQGRYGQRFIGNMVRQCTQPKRPRNSGWFKEKMLLVQADDLNSYDSDCDDISSTKAILMANLSSYGSNILSEVVKVRTTPDVITEGSWGFEHTKAVFMQEVIPFIKNLKDIFTDSVNGLYSEINEMKTMFNEMKAATEQCFTGKRYFDIQKK